MTGFLTNILSGIYSLVGNYGWAIVLFTILIRIVLLPLDIKNRQGMRKMQKIQPQLNALQQKYANDKVKLQQKQSELMRKERYNPLSGCLPLLIQMPVLFAMFAAMRAIANEQTVRQVFTFLSGHEPVYEGWFWVKNLWMPDSPFAAIAPDIKTVNMLRDTAIWQNVFASLSPENVSAIVANLADKAAFTGALDFVTKDGFAATLPAIEQALAAMPAYQTALNAMPGWQNLNFMLFSVTVFLNFNGLLILPVLSGVSQMLMTKLTPATAAPQQDGQANGSANFMKYFFPVFSVWICLTSNAGFALYWVVSNLIAIASNYLINAYYDRKDKLEAAQKGEVK